MTKDDLLQILKSNTELDISKSELRNKTGKKFIRINRYLYDINKREVQRQRIVNQENEYRIDYVQYQLNDINYYWVILRLNDNIDFLDVSPYLEYKLDINYKNIINSTTLLL